MGSEGAGEWTQPLPRRLPIEIYRHILSYISPDNESAIHIDKAIVRRRFLSVESLEPPDPSEVSVRDARAAIGKFRELCRVFAEIGAPFLFTQIAIRFSRKGLQNLERLAGWKHLARHVKRFSYMVPYFFEGGEFHRRFPAVERSLTYAGLNNLDEIREELRQIGLRPSDLQILRDKAAEQGDIISREYDARVLASAISSFTSLQLIQLLRVSETQTEIVLDYLRHHAEARENLNLDWTSACRHASLTIGTALLASENVQWQRFYLPVASPTSARFLKMSLPHSVSTLSERLTCLTLQFDDSDELDAKVQDLSEMFEAIFSQAKKMKVIHIGFPSHRPVSLPLESVFHHVTWDDLVAFGVQGWELDAEEIVTLLGRHKSKLRGVRLRDVHLKEGSMWKDVLDFLRGEMRQLLWVSLRRIGYTAFFRSDEHLQSAGTEIPAFIGESDSDYEDELPQGPGNQVDSQTGSDRLDDNDDDADDEDDDEEEESEDEDSDEFQLDSDDEHGHEMEFPDLSSPVTPASATPWCTCRGRGYLESADDLDDDGWRVDNAKRKHWERWVLWRCPEHGER